MSEIKKKIKSLKLLYKTAVKYIKTMFSNIS